MSTQYVRYPNFGVPIYASLSVFPAVSINGQLAVAADTDTLYIFNGSAWVAVGSGSSVLSIGTIDSNGASANGASIHTNALVMQSASSTAPGLVNNTTQTFSGAKTFSSNTAITSLAAYTAGGLLDVASNAGSAILNTVYDNTAAPAFLSRRARGTFASPTAVQTDDELGRFGVRGYGTTGFSTTRGLVRFQAAENWTDTANGNYFTLFTAPIGSTSAALRLTISDAGTATFTGPVVTQSITVNAYQFGAVADFGITDNTPAIITALASFPAGGGTLLINAGVKWTYSGVTQPDNVNIIDLSGWDSQFNEWNSAVHYYLKTDSPNTKNEATAFTINANWHPSLVLNNQVDPSVNPRASIWFRQQGADIWQVGKAGSGSNQDFYIVGRLVTTHGSSFFQIQDGTGLTTIAKQLGVAGSTPDANVAAKFKFPHAAPSGSIVNGGIVIEDFSHTAAYLSLGIDGSSGGSGWLQAKSNNDQSAISLVLNPIGGNVGIGKSPSVALDVSGAITASGALTASNFSGSSSGTNTGDVTLAAVGSSPSASGASLSGQVLTLQPADSTHPGVVTTAAQTFAGAKTFSSAPIVSTLSVSQAVFSDGSKNLVSNAITGSGNVVMSASPTLTGTLTLTGDETVSGNMFFGGINAFPTNVVGPVMITSNTSPTISILGYSSTAPIFQGFSTPQTTVGSTPTATAIDKLLVTLQGGGYDGTNWQTTGGSLSIRAAEAWGAGARGAYMRLNLIEPGTTTSRAVFFAYGNSDMVFGLQSALATNATTGFMYMPAGAGIPTGVPSLAPTGKVAWYYDTSDNRLYIYNGAWKFVALA